MENKITPDIISRVKNALGITEDIDEMQLYSILCNTVILSHPDKVSDKEAKQIAEERFKLLNPLRKEFKAYIDKNQVGTALATVEDKQKSLTIMSIDKATERELEMLVLSDEIKQLRVLLEIEKNNNKKILDKYNAFVEQTTNVSKDNLSEIYRPQKIGNAIGICAAIALLASLLPQVKAFTTTLGLTGLLADIIIYAVTLVWIIKWIRTMISSAYMESVIDKILVEEDLMVELNVKTDNNKFQKAYFSENDICNLVDKFLNKIFYKVLYFGFFSHIKRQLISHIILELENKHFIVSTETINMQKVFYVEYKGSICDTSF